MDVICGQSLSLPSLMCVSKQITIKSVAAGFFLSLNFINKGYLRMCKLCRYKPVVPTCVQHPIDDVQIYVSAITIIKLETFQKYWKVFHFMILKLLPVFRQLILLRNQDCNQPSILKFLLLNRTLIIGKFYQLIDLFRF